MTKKSNQPRRRGKKRRSVNVAIVAATITALGGIAAVIIQTYGGGDSTEQPGGGQARVPAEASSATHPAHHESQGPSVDVSVRGLHPETVEYAATVFANYDGPSGIEGQAAPGQILHVLCRVPGDPTTPASVGSAGWYRIRQEAGSVAYVAANTFYNDPHDGYGMRPNHNALDPAVPVC
jgi:hypothetical protein